jgi:hypothetical protein
MLENVVANVYANLIVASLLAALAIPIFFIDRQKLFRFFGISSRNPTIRIYLSRLEIKPGGTSGIEPISEGYRGPGIARVEYDAALTLQRQLASRVAGLVPRGVKAWVQLRRPVLFRLEPRIAVSPPRGEGLAQENMIVLGSSIYNSVSKSYLEHTSSHFLFETEGGHRVVRVRRPGTPDITLRRVAANGSDRQEIGTIQRFNDHDHSRTVFICAGTGSTATAGSAEYLAAQWPALFRDHRNEEFALYLIFKGQCPDAEIVRPPDRVEIVCGGAASAAGGATKALGRDAPGLSGRSRPLASSRRSRPRCRRCPRTPRSGARWRRRKA